MGEINYLFGDVEYIDKPNHLVISASHLHRLPESKVPEFIQKLDTLKGMKIEARPLPSDVPYDLIEVLAKAAMVGKPFEYIAITRPDGTPLGEVIKEYELPMELVEVYIGFEPMLMSDMKPITDGEQMADYVLLAIETAKERYPNLDRIRAVRNHIKIMKNLVLTNDISIKEIKQFCEAYLLYHGQIIEYECIQPDILDFRSRIEGKIGVLVGGFHAEGIDEMLEGNLREKPPSWQDYRKVLPQSILGTLSSIEELILSD